MRRGPSQAATLAMGVLITLLVLGLAGGIVFPRVAIEVCGGFEENLRVLTDCMGAWADRLSRVLLVLAVVGAAARAMVIWRRRQARLRSDKD